MKFVCNQCKGESACTIIFDGPENCEHPYACPFAFLEEDSNAAWKELKEEKKSMKSKTCTCGEGAEKSKRGKILMQALEIINGERQDQYGNPEDSFSLIGKYWTSFLIANGIVTDDGAQISPKEVAEMMMLFKIARMSGQKPKLDNYLDLVGYAGIAADMVEG